MRVVRYDQFDGIDRLWIDEVAVPDAARGHVVVQIRAACINPGSLSALRGVPSCRFEIWQGTRPR